MKKRPHGLTITALILLLAALGMPIQAAELQGLENTLTSLTDLNWLTILSLVACAIGVYHAAPHATGLLAFTVLMVFLNNFWVGWVGLDYSLLETSLASLAILFAMAPLLTDRNARLVLKDHKLKWWVAAERKKLRMEVELSPFHSQMKISAETFDISNSGLYVPLTSHSNFKFSEGQRFEMTLKSNSHQPIRAQGQLVRISEGQGSYPRGLGFRITPRGAEDRNNLHRALAA